jgi:hypothetical protein
MTWIAVQQLRKGMKVMTNAHGPKEVIQTAYFVPSEGSDVVRFEPGPLSPYPQPLVLTTGHRLLWPRATLPAALEELDLPLFDETFVPVPAYLDPRGTIVSCEAGERFWAVVLEEDVPGHTYGIWANGLLVESTGADRLHEGEATMILGGPLLGGPRDYTNSSQFYVTGPSTVNLSTSPVNLSFTVVDILATSEGGWTWKITHIATNASWASPGEVAENFSWTLNPSYPPGTYKLVVTEVSGVSPITTLTFTVQAEGVCLGEGAYVLLA